METATKLRKATRQKALLRLGLSGPSGSGKTVSALLLAYGITGDWNKIALIDTENGSADLYANHTLQNGFLIGEFNVYPLIEPYHPNRYIEAIEYCEQAQMEVIIVDSITHEWNGKGGCLEIHEQETNKMRIPNSFMAWAKITPLHQKFIDTILQSSCHIITAVRSKTDYVLTERNGRQIPQKVGMAAQTRDGYEYELTFSLDLDIEHRAFVSKDRTGLFVGKEPAIITPDTGKMIMEWCNTGVEVIPVASLINIEEAVSKCNLIFDTEEAISKRNSIFDIEEAISKCNSRMEADYIWRKLSAEEKVNSAIISIFKKRGSEIENNKEMQVI